MGAETVLGCGAETADVVVLVISDGDEDGGAGVSGAHWWVQTQEIQLDTKLETSIKTTPPSHTHTHTHTHTHIQTTPPMWSSQVRDCVRARRVDVYALRLAAQTARIDGARRGRRDVSRHVRGRGPGAVCCRAALCEPGQRARLRRARAGCGVCLCCGCDGTSGVIHTTGDVPDICRRCRGQGALADRPGGGCGDPPRADRGRSTGERAEKTRLSANPAM
jgi:hypothetical protein